MCPRRSLSLFNLPVVMCAQGDHFHFSICQLLHVLKDVFSLFNLLVVTCTQRSLYTFTFFSFRCAPGRRATLGRSRSQSSRNGATSPPRSLASNKTRKIQEMFESQCGKVESQKAESQKSAHPGEGKLFLLTQSKPDNERNCGHLRK